MNNTYFVTLLVALVVAASGCASSEQPEERETANDVNGIERYDTAKQDEGMDRTIYEESGVVCYSVTNGVSYFGTGCVPLSQTNLN